MTSQASLDRCLTFINCQLSPAEPASRRPEYHAGFRSITVSRQAGSGAHLIAERLCELLPNGSPDASRWTVFDRNLVEKVLEDHKLPVSLAKFMREDKVSEIADAMDELFGLHPSSYTLVHKTAQTILHLAQLGNVILIGRGAPVITARLNYVFRVRLVGSFERRLQHVQEYYNMDAHEGTAFIRREDEGRRRFLKQHFDRDIDDPLLYHLVVNTDLVPYEEAAQLIAREMLRSREGCFEPVAQAELAEND